MAQTTLSQEEQIRRIRAANPQFPGTDTELYRWYQRQHPDQFPAPTSEATGPEYGWGTTALTPAARVGTPMIGALAGSIAVPGPGTAVGGIGGGIAGEAIAQGIEQFLGHRDEFNPYSKGVAGAISAVPIGKPIAATLRGAPLAHALKSQLKGEIGKGTGVGFAGDLGFQLAEKDPDDPLNLTRSALVGLGSGTLAGVLQRGIFQRKAWKKARQKPATTAVPVLDDAIEALKTL